MKDAGTEVYDKLIKFPKGAELIKTGGGRGVLYFLCYFIPY